MHVDTCRLHHEPMTLGHEICHLLAQHNAAQTNGRPTSCTLQENSQPTARHTAIWVPGSHKIHSAEVVETGQQCLSRQIPIACKLQIRQCFGNEKQLQARYLDPTFWPSFDVQQIWPDSTIYLCIQYDKAHHSRQWHHTSSEIEKPGHALQGSGTLSRSPQCQVGQTRFHEGYRSDAGGEHITANQSRPTHHDI